MWRGQDRLGAVDARPSAGRQGHELAFYLCCAPMDTVDDELIRVTLALGEIKRPPAQLIVRIPDRASTWT